MFRIAVPKNFTNFMKNVRFAGKAAEFFFLIFFYFSLELSTFLVFMKHSGTRNIENHKLLIDFLASIAKLSWI